MFAWGEQPASAEGDVADEGVTKVDLDLATKGRKPTAEDGQIVGRVTRNGEPLAKATVMVYGQEFRRVKTDENGNYDLGAVKAGSFQLEVQSGEGGRGNWQRIGGQHVKLGVGETKRIDFNIYSAGPVRGIVRSAVTGGPLAGAWVNATIVPKKRNPKDPENSTDDFEWGMGSGAQVMTDAKGEFDIEEISEGTYFLNVTANGHAPGRSGEIVVARGSSVAPVEITLQAGIVVSGSVAFDASVKLEYGGLSFNGVDGTPGSAWAQINSDKQFSVDTLTPGKYQVYFYTWGSGARWTTRCRSSSRCRSTFPRGLEGHDAQVRDPAQDHQAGARAGRKQGTVAFHGNQPNPDRGSDHWDY